MAEETVEAPEEEAVEAVEKGPKKLLRIKPWGDTGTPSANYADRRIKFAFLHKSGDERKQAMSFMTCRDHMNDSLRAFIHKKVGSNCVYCFKNNLPIDMDNLRLLIARDCSNRKERYQFKEKLFSAKKLVNFYEKVAGWEPSTITTVRMEGGRAKNVWLLTGPREWLAYSQLLSMVTLLLRVVTNYGPIAFTDNASIEKWYYSLITNLEAEMKSGIFSHDPDIDHYLRASWDKFYMIVTHYDEIFIQPLEQAHPEEGSVHAQGGIYHLCRFSTQNETLDGNMRKTYESYIKQKEEGLKAKAHAVEIG